MGGEEETSGEEEGKRQQWKTYATEKSKEGLFRGTAADQQKGDEKMAVGWWIKIHENFQKEL